MKKSPESIKILFSDQEESYVGAQIVWPGQNLKKAISELRKSETIGGEKPVGVKIIDVPVHDEQMESVIRAMAAMDKPMDYSVGDLLSSIADAVKHVYSAPPGHEEFVAKKDELMRSKLEALGLPENTTWEDYFLAAMGDAPYHVAEYFRLKGFSNKEIEMLYKIFRRPVLGDNIRVKSITEVIRRMMGLDK